jgi:hypothetical protein
MAELSLNYMIDLTISHSPLPGIPMDFPAQYYDNKIRVETVSNCSDGFWD